MDILILILGLAILVFGAEILIRGSVSFGKKLNISLFAIGVVIVAAAKVGGILANTNQPASFLLETIKIQTNIIETCYY